MPGAGSLSVVNSAIRTARVTKIHFPQGASNFRMIQKVSFLEVCPKKIVTLV
jgi:hypothetical protein